MSWLDEIFFPRRCPVCLDIVQPWGAMVCDTCRAMISLNTDKNCMKCGRILKYEEKEYCISCREQKKQIERGIIGFDYRKDWVNNMMMQVKYHNGRQLLDVPCKEAAIAYTETVDKWNCECLVPVPLHISRRKKRGFNQAEEIAIRLSYVWNIPIETRLIFRVKKTKPQKELGSMSRRGNLMDAFWVDKKTAEKYKRVLLVDDIYTTGSTMEACAQRLLMAGISKIYSFALTSGADETNM